MCFWCQIVIISNFQSCLKTENRNKRCVRCFIGKFFSHPFANELEYICIIAIKFNKSANFRFSKVHLKNYFISFATFFNLFIFHQHRIAIQDAYYRFPSEYLGYKIVLMLKKSKPEMTCPWMNLSKLLHKVFSKN